MSEKEIQEALEKCEVFFGFECDLCPAKEVCKKDDKEEIDDNGNY